jgi:S-adenosylmethionine:tRNA ribosyltransferase-isomerase
MRVDAFDFTLPEDLIALRPAVPRDSARLLVVHPDGSLEHSSVSKLPELLRLGDAVVVNDTKVIPSRLRAIRPSRDGNPTPGARVEVTLHKRVADGVYRALARPAKRLKPGDRIRFGDQLGATVVARDAGEIELEFDRMGPALDTALAELGEMPLPPYIASRRSADDADRRDYQTIFGSQPGAVAAPTAGLHFSERLVAQLGARGIAQERVTLHVGPGTFLPVTADTTEDHRMQSEWARLSTATAGRLNAVRERGRRVVAVGSTACRTLETAAEDSGRLHGFEGETALFITPGYRFKAVDVMLTNFHLPRSTLFMLVSAFCGTEVMQHAYREAIARRYRFYSYGDACLLFRP